MNTLHRNTSDAAALRKCLAAQQVAMELKAATNKKLSADLRKANTEIARLKTIISNNMKNGESFL